jgi:alcohol dehydrogenase, propanol-preferring
MQLMRAYQLLHPAAAETFPLRLADMPVLEPGPGQVRLRVRACGVCHTDLHIIEGEIHPPMLPVIPGHQVVGIIDAIGADGQLPVRLPLHVDDRVGVPWLHWACGACEFCRRGEENLCSQARFTGFHVAGGFAETMLAEANYVLPLPDGLSDEQAAPLLCAGIIGYRSLRVARLAPGERLGLAGFGASAHLAIQLARHWGCPVAVFTRSSEHRRHAEELGAAWVGGADDQPPWPLDRAVTFAPLGELVPKMLAKLRPGGTLAINAIHMSPIPAMSYSLLYGERTVSSVANATYQDGVEFLRLAAEIPIQATVSLYPFEDASKALLDLKGSKIIGEAVLSI